MIKRRIKREGRTSGAPLLVRGRRRSDFRLPLGVHLYLTDATYAIYRYICSYWNQRLEISSLAPADASPPPPPPLFLPHTPRVRPSATMDPVALVDRMRLPEPVRENGMNVREMEAKEAVLSALPNLVRIVEKGCVCRGGGR